MSKFSPGPWKADGFMVFDSTQGVVCRSGPIDTDRLWHANARLIAAAPAMHEWLALVAEGKPLSPKELEGIRFLLRPNRG